MDMWNAANNTMKAAFVLGLLAAVLVIVEIAMGKKHEHKWMEITAYSLLGVAAALGIADYAGYPVLDSLPTLSVP